MLSKTTLRVSGYDYFKHDEQNRLSVLNSHTKTLLRYKYVSLIIPMEWMSDEVQCPMCRNYVSSLVTKDSDGIKWFKCNYHEHLQFNWPPFLAVKNPTGITEWTFSQDSRIRYGGLIFTKHDTATGKELGDWVSWSPRDTLWQFDVKEETWRQA